MQMLVSTAEAVQRCWKATDAFFDSIEDWSVQPIDVRRPFGFYYGHLASFAKLKLLPQVSSETSLASYSWFKNFLLWTPCFFCKAQVAA